jgi:hypothetical protein
MAMKKLLIVLLLVLLTACDLPVDTPQPDVYVEVLPGVDTVSLGDTWMDAGAIFHVLEEEYNTLVTGTVDTNTSGLYQITYSNTYGDETYTGYRYVMVVDDQAPELTLKPGLDTISVGEEWMDAGILWTDNSGSVIINKTGTVDTSVAGEYEIIYEVTDSSGNTATIYRYVSVVE